MLNKTTLIGRIANDLKLSMTKNNKKSAFFTIATDNGYGENKTTTFVPVTCYENLAENVNKFCKKGSKIYAEGKITIYPRDINGTQVNQTIITLHNVLFLENKKKDDNIPKKELENIKFNDSVRTADTKNNKTKTVKFDDFNGDEQAIAWGE